MIIYFTCLEELPFLIGVGIGGLSAELQHLVAQL